MKKTDRNELFYYLIYRECKLDGKPIESVKSLDSHVKFVDGYLRDYCATKISNGIVVVKGLVTHSMAYTKPPLNCWVALERQGGILCGHCDCKAGLGGSCSHVGVVLWGIVNLSEETCTSTLQRWHNKNPTNHPELPTTISSLKTAKRGAIVDKMYDAVTDETLNALLENLEKGTRHVALHRLMEPFSADCLPLEVKTPLPERLTSLFDQSWARLPISEIQTKCEDLLVRYSITVEQRNVIELLTRRQANCKQWNKAREGRVTASKVYDVSKTNLSNPSKSLLQQVAYPTDCAFRSKATDWGIKHEGAAIRRF